MTTTTATTPTEFQFNVAERKQLSLKIIVGGPPGAGKTLSSLILAAGMIGIHENLATWDDVAFADTESESALYYAGTLHDMAYGEGLIEIGKFTHIPFKPPYHPDRWIRLIREIVAKRKKIAILDSTTHEWTGVGGCLDWHRECGGRAQDWGRVSPRHQAFLDEVRNAPIPIIVNLREAVEHRIENENGKVVVQKVGLKPQQREGFEYEYDLQLSLSQRDHTATASKDRTGLLQPLPPAVVTYRTGRVLANWANSGADAVGSRGWIAKRCDELRHAKDEDTLKRIFMETNAQAAGLLVAESRDAIARAKDAAKARLGIK